MPHHSLARTSPHLTAPLRVGMLGIGTVGSGTCRVLKRNQQLISARAGKAIELRAVSTRTLARAQGIVDKEVHLIANPEHLVRHPEIDVVVEAIGGCSAAFDLVMQAIAQGKHVVTANKALLALHGTEIFAAARAHGVIVAYEGAVAVSIPIVKTLREGLTANHIHWLAGIVNGTSNFILTRMRDTGLSFDAALKEAQALGYAEADPTLDVGGFDAAHKLALLASLAFGIPLQYDKISVEGISSVQSLDLQCAARLGYDIKSLAIARRGQNGIQLGVHPALVSSSSLLARVDGSMNGILVGSDAAGITLHYGAGAGSEQTASAVIADLIDIARLGHSAGSAPVPTLGFQHDALEDLPVVPNSARVGQSYLRIPLACSDSAPDLLANLERRGIRAETFFETGEASEASKPGAQARRHLVLITADTADQCLADALRMQALPGASTEAISRIRIENFPQNTSSPAR